MRIGARGAVEPTANVPLRASIPARTPRSHRTAPAMEPSPGLRQTHTTVPIPGRKDRHRRRIRETRSRVRRAASLEDPDADPQGPARRAPRAPALATRLRADIA